MSGCLAQGEMHVGILSQGFGGTEVSQGAWHGLVAVCSARVVMSLLLYPQDFHHTELRYSNVLLQK